MTSTKSIIKTDCLGRITVSREYREALLDEFERGSMKGQAFAEHHGLKYQTFASWIQKRRRARGDYEMLKHAGAKLEKKKSSAASRLELTLAEVSMQTHRGEASNSNPGLNIFLSNHAKIELQHSSQIPLVMELLKAYNASESC